MLIMGGSPGSLIYGGPSQVGNPGIFIEQDIPELFQTVSTRYWVAYSGKTNNALFVSSEFSAPAGTTEPPIKRSLRDYSASWEDPPTGLTTLTVYVYAGLEICFDTYVPVIFEECEMLNLNEKWKVISPVESTNYVLNPSAETTSNYSALGAATITRSTTYQKYGNYSYRVQTGSTGQGISLTLLTLPNENCFATFRARGKLPIQLRTIIGSGWRTPILIEKIDNDWNMYGVQFNAAECSGRTEFRIIQQGNGIGDFYVDGIQVENLEYWTSYIDGDQEGCAWNGPEHAATSTRSGLSRAGGQVKNLFDDYGFFVDKVIGTGATNRNLEIDDYALLPGGELNEIKIQSRQWSLIGKFIADSDDELYENRRELLKLLRKNAQKEPIKFLFYHPEGVREIKAFYSGGLEGDQSVFYDSWVTDGDDRWANLNKYIEKSAIQLVSPDPYFYGQGDRNASLDVNNSATFRTIAARLASTEQWSNLGPPSITGTYNNVWALAEDATYIYIGGNFDNWNGIANADNIVRYNKLTGVYSAMGSGVNDNVYALAIAPNGDLYIGGAFIDATPSGAGDCIVGWNGSSYFDVGVPSGTPLSSVRALAFDNLGNLYIGGVFTNWGVICAACDNIVMWNGSTYSALSSGLNGSVFSIKVRSDNTIFIGGSFTNVGPYVVSWNGSAFTNLAGLNNEVYALEFSPDKAILYAGGFFATPYPYIAQHNGTAWSGLGSGANNYVYTLSTGPDGTLYAGGVFTQIGGVSLADRVAKWNGYSWSQLDIDFPGSAIIYSILSSYYNIDPALLQKYDLYLGFDSTELARFAGQATINNRGSVDVFPKITFQRFGGTGLTIVYVKNETTEKQLFFNYPLQDQEKLLVDLTPTHKSIISSFWGSRLNAISANSNFGDFVLETENNTISCFTSGDISLYPSTVDAFIIWKDTFESYD